MSRLRALERRRARAEKAAAPLGQLGCDVHGVVSWKGEIACPCGALYTSQDPSLPTHAPAQCACGAWLFPVPGALGPAVAVPVCSLCYAAKVSP